MLQKKQFIHKDQKSEWIKNDEHRKLKGNRRTML